MTSTVQVLPSGRIRCNSIVLYDPQTADAILIDPSDDATRMLAWVGERELHVSHILLTHAHPDHVGDIARVVRVFDLVPHLHPADLTLYRQFAAGQNVPVPAPLAHDQIILAGTCLELRVLHLPGHTPGSCGFYLAGAHQVFCGDTLFYGAVGRTDIPGGDADALTRSIRNVLYTLPDDTTVYPGHGPMTSIGEEKMQNPFVQAHAL